MTRERDGVFSRVFASVVVRRAAVTAAASFFMFWDILWCGLAAAGAVGPEIVESKLESGATLVVSEQRNLPIVLVRVLLDAGGRRDPARREGLANLTADLLTEGTNTRTAAEISEAIDFIGGSLGSSAGMDYALVSLHVLKKDLEIGGDLLADVLLRPAFSEAELARRREAVLAGIRSRRDDPTSVANKAFQEAVFENEPYGHPTEGTEASVPSITRADVQSFYARYYGPAGALIVVVGDISAGEAREVLNRKLAGWNGADESRFAYPQFGDTSAKTVRIDKEVTQAAIVLGHRGVARNNPDYETLQVMNYILGGGGFSSRLTDSIRVQAGLAYSVSSSFGASKSTGAFRVVMQTKNTSVGEGLERARKEIARIRDEFVGEEELDEARRYLTGSFPLSLDSLHEVADFISQVVFYDLGADYAERYLSSIAAVTKEDVRDVARRYLHPEGLIEVVVADLDQIGKK